MKFRFSVKSLFIITTVIAVLMGITIRLDLVSQKIVASFVVYFIVYLGIVCLFFGPRYFHELQEFREKRGRQRLTKASLEEEARQRLAAAKSSKQQNEQDTKEV